MDREDRPAADASGAATSPGDTVAIPSAALESSDPLIGQLVGNFRIVRRLGAGGMGVVYLGEHAVIGSRVAVKMLHPHLAGDPALVGRFLAEARAVNLIGHENIVCIFDLNRLGADRYYLVMEYLEGRTLAGAGPMAPGEAVSILAQICQALEAAHSTGIVHRDLKPENVFLIRRGGADGFVKLVDFGIAKLQSGVVGSGHTIAGMVVGTPEFMPPEQWAGEAIDGRADLYALGVMAFQLLTGKLPFAANDVIGFYRQHLEAPVPSLRALNPQVGEALEQVVVKALAKQRGERFENARAMKEALERALQAPAAPLAAAAPTPAASPRASPPVVAGQASWSGQASRPVRLGQFSRAGAFVETGAPFPALFERVSLVLEHLGARIACEGEVVRHVTGEQARTWGMSEGFAVQFDTPSLALREAVDRILLGKPLLTPASAAPAKDDPAVDQALARFQVRATGDHYRLLEAAEDAECSELRQRSRKAIAELEGLASRMSLKQRDLADSMLMRIHAAMTVLGTPAWRAAFDASRGNFRGVARCIQAGLNAGELEGLRQNHLSAHPGADATAMIRGLTASSYQAANQLAKATEELEAALRLDPLSLPLQQRYWALKRSTRPPAAPK